MSNGDLESRIREIEARQQIWDAVANFARGVDRCDAEIIRSAFHPDARDDHGSFAGTVEELIEWVLKLHLEGYVWTTHALTNHYVEFGTDGKARAETYVTGVLRFEHGGKLHDLIGQGRYIDVFEERDGTWRISDRKVLADYNRIETVVDYSAFAADVAAGGDEVVAGLIHGTRDADDGSYALFAGGRS